MRQALSERPRLSDKEGFASFVLRMRGYGIDDPRLFAAIDPRRARTFWRRPGPILPIVPVPFRSTAGSIWRDRRSGPAIAALRLEPGHRVLEIGTGSGFTAAVMSSLAGRITTVERYRKLCDRALQQFVSLKRENIVLKHTDGRHGMPGGPFDRILVWLAFEEVPRQFVELLATNGVLIAPIGPGDGPQVMTRIGKIGSRFEQEDLMTVRYQPLSKASRPFCEIPASHTGEIMGFRQNRGRNHSLMVFNW